MNTKNKLLAYAGVMGTGVIGVFLWSIRALLPVIAVWVVGAILIILGCVVLTVLGKLFFALRSGWLQLQLKQEELASKQEQTKLLQAGINYQQVLTHLALTRIYPDAKGFFPVLTNDNMQLQPGQMNLLMLPQYNQPRQQQLSPALETTLEDLPPLESFEKQPVKTFRELLQDGTIPAILKQGQMVLGYVNGALRMGSWTDLYSCGIGGVSGSGKSTTVRFLLFQGLLAAAKLIMVDPHIGDEEESLAAQFRQFTGAHLIQPCDGRTQNVLKRIDWLQKEYQRREARGIKGPGIIFVIDEFNELMRNKDIREAMADLLLNIAQGGRKFGIFAMLIGQRWSAQDLGGAEIRTSLASMLAHRFTDEDQAKKMIGGRHGPKCLELPKGHYLFRDTDGGIAEMITPATYARDGELIQSLLLGYGDLETRFETGSKVVESTPKLELHLTTSEPAFERETSPEITEISTLAAQIIALQAEGIQKQEIMKRLWNVTPGASKDYQTAQEEYKQIMRFIQTQLA